MVSVLCLAYLIDFAVLRWKVANTRNAMGVVTVRPYYAVPRKDHREEYIIDDPTDVSCVHSLFPHAGASPCWYLSRHRDRRIDM